MPETRHIEPRSGDVLVMIGTMKGAFLFRSGSDRAEWQMAGPYFPGQVVYALAFDGRAGRTRLWAAPKSWQYGSMPRSSDDFGRTWTNPEVAPVKFPEGAGAALEQIWQIQPGPSSQPDTLYCGVEPAALFVSRDAGTSWSLMEGLWSHPQRERWQPGAGGLCLHTVLVDPHDTNRLRVAISAAGMYASSDGGATWYPSNRGVRAEFLPDKYPEFGQCVHKVVQAAGNPGRLFLQNHWGLYRSDDHGENWTDVANGVPSDFGFCLAAHPRNGDTAWIVPLESDEFRCTPEGKLRAYRTRDAGVSWQALSDGLPQQNAFETVLRDALSADSLDPAGVYFGTRSGKVFGSADEGDHWQLLADGLPPVVAVKTAVVP